MLTGLSISRDAAKENGSMRPYSAMVPQISYNRSSDIPDDDVNRRVLSCADVGYISSHTQMYYLVISGAKYPRIIFYIMI